MAAKTALEVRVDRHDGDIVELKTSSKSMAAAFNDMGEKLVTSMEGLRRDMTDRGERMINLLNTQGAETAKNHAEHQLSDAREFSAIRKERDDAVTILKRESDANLAAAKKEAADEIKRLDDQLDAMKGDQRYYLGMAVGGSAVISLLITALGAIYEVMRHGNL